MPSNRLDRINEAVRKELSSRLREVKDPRVRDTMISITRVEVTADQKYAKVYVSFLETEKAKEALKGLKSAAGFLRRDLARTLQLRCTPELQWVLDESIVQGAKMLELLRSLEESDADDES